MSSLNAGVVTSTDCATISKRLHRPTEIGCVVTGGWVVGIALLSIAVVELNVAGAIERDSELEIKFVEAATIVGFVDEAASEEREGATVR